MTARCVEHAAKLVGVKLDYPYIQAGRYKRGRVHAPELIVLHWSAGGGDDDAIASYFVNPRKKAGVDKDGKTVWVRRNASYTFAVGRVGSITQMVDTENTAWHSGRGTDWLGRKGVNDRSIGLCLANRGPIKRAKAQQLGPYVHVGRHPKPGFRGYGQLFEGFPAEQLDAAALLIRQLVAAIPTLTSVCGHEDLVRGKGDPGPALLEWDPGWEEIGVTRRVKDWTTGKWDVWRQTDHLPTRPTHDYK